VVSLASVLFLLPLGRAAVWPAPATSMNGSVTLRVAPSFAFLDASAKQTSTLALAFQRYMVSATLGKRLQKEVDTLWLRG
jgi:hypothetical protein